MRNSLPSVAFISPIPSNHHSSSPYDILYIHYDKFLLESLHFVYLHDKRIRLRVLLAIEFQVNIKHWPFYCISSVHLQLPLPLSAVKLLIFRQRTKFFDLNLPNATLFHETEKVYSENII